MWLAFVAVVEFFVEFVVAELCFGVRFAFGYDFVVELALDLTVQHLEFLVRDLFQGFREFVVRGEVQFLGHCALHILCAKIRAYVLRMATF